MFARKMKNKKGQMTLVLVLFLSFMIPVFIGSIEYMRSVLERVDRYNKLDIVAISSIRAKAAIYNQISQNNKIIISLINIHGLLRCLKIAVPKLITIIEPVLMIIKKSIVIISKFNLYLKVSTKSLLVALLAQLNLKNSIIVIPSKGYKHHFLRKIDKLKLLRKIYFPYKGLKDLNIFDKAKNFNESKRVQFKATFNHFMSFKRISLTTLLGKKKKHLSVQGKLKGENMFGGSFKAYLVLGVRGENE